MVRFYVDCANLNYNGDTRHIDLNVHRQTALVFVRSINVTHLINNRQFCSWNGTLYKNREGSRFTNQIHIYVRT